MLAKTEKDILQTRLRKQEITEQVKNENVVFSVPLLKLFG